jgi:phosphoglycolate phosphatase-like HAD superfamily hydrolase
MWKENYTIIQLNNNHAFVKKDSIEKLAKVDAIIFDCDGVLIDVTKSYLMAIKETVNYIFNRLTGLRIEEKLLDNLIYQLKKGGRFNNDWAVSYTISLLALTAIPKEAKEQLKRTIDSELFKFTNEPLDRLIMVEKCLKEKIKNIGFKISEESSKRLIELAGIVSSSSFKSFEELATNSLAMEDDLEILRYGRDILSPYGSVGDSLVTTIFEEKFLGCNLFKEIYGLDCKFHKGKGLIDNERIIIDRENLKEISSLIGKSNFGIASGRPIAATKYTMKDLLNEFRPEAKAFLEDIDEAERRAREKGEIIDLSKPNPYSLIKCARGLMPFNFALYLGDSMEDLMMVELANEIKACYLFGGVYAHSLMKNEQKTDFIKKGADLILPSVRELPSVLKIIKEGRSFA